MTRKLSYDIVSRKMTSDPNTRVNFVEAKCATCGRADGFIFKTTQNPYHITNKFKQMGWKFDTYIRSKIQCPDCQKKTTHTDTDEFLPTLETFGQRFRWLREHAHISLDQIAEEATFDRHILQKLESGEEHPYTIEQGSISRLIEALVNHKVPVNRAWLLDTQGQGAILASNVYKAMVKMNFIETSLAEASRVPIQQIKLILSGHIPTHYKLPEIAKVLHTTPELLMGMPAKGEKPKPDTTELVLLSSNLRASRLREARQAKNLGQRQLGELIRSRDPSYTVETLKWMISRIENGEDGGRKDEHILQVASEFLEVPAEWLLGRTDLPDAVPLQHKIGISETDAEQMVDRLVRAESDVAGLNQLIEEAVQPLRQMADEITTTVRDLRDRLSRMPLPHRIMVKLMPQMETPVETDPVPLPVIQGYHLLQKRMDGEPAHAPMLTQPKVEQAVVEPVEQAVEQPVAEQPVVQTRVHGPIKQAPINGTRLNGTRLNGTRLNGTPVHRINGHSHKPIVAQAEDHFIGFIDRDRQSKQNMFAQALARCGALGEFDLDTIRKKLASDLRRVLPVGCANPDAYVHALLRRECEAHNGLLTRVTRGRWQFRDRAHI